MVVQFWHDQLNVWKGFLMKKQEAQRFAKKRTLPELYEIIRLSSEYERTDENLLIVAVVDAEIRNRVGQDHPVGLASILAPRP